MQPNSRLGIILNSVTSIFDESMKSKDLLPLDCQVLQMFLMKYDYKIIYHDFRKDFEGLKVVLESIQKIIHEYEVVIMYVNGRGFWNQKDRQTLLIGPNDQFICIETEIMSIQKTFKSRVIPIVCILNCDRIMTLRQSEESPYFQMTGLIIAYMTRPSHVKIQLPEFYAVGSLLHSLIKKIELSSLNKINLQFLHRILKNSCMDINSYEDHPSSKFATEFLQNDAVFFQVESNHILKQELLRGKDFTVTVTSKKDFGKQYFPESNGNYVGQILNSYRQGSLNHQLDKINQYNFSRRITGRHASTPSLKVDVTPHHVFRVNIMHTLLGTPYEMKESFYRQGFGIYIEHDFRLEGQWDKGYLTGRGIIEDYFEQTIKSDNGKEIQIQTNSYPTILIGWFKKNNLEDGCISAEWQSDEDLLGISEIKNHKFNGLAKRFCEKPKQIYVGECIDANITGEGYCVFENKNETKEERGTFNNAILIVQKDIEGEEMQVMRRKFQIPR